MMKSFHSIESKEGYIDDIFNSINFETFMIVTF